MTEVAYFISSPPDVAHTGDGRRKGKTPKEKERAARFWACSEELYDCHRFYDGALIRTEILMKMEGLQVNFLS